jgi:hypothetical protein
MAKVSEQYPNPWLYPEDLKGGQAMVTVSQVEAIAFANKFKDGVKEDKFVLSFEGKKKKLILQPLQAKALAKVIGDDTDTWPGQAVCLYSYTTDKQKLVIGFMSAKQTQSI